MMMRFEVGRWSLAGTARGRCRRFPTAKIPQGLKPHSYLPLAARLKTVSFPKSFARLSPTIPLGTGEDARAYTYTVVG